MDRRQLLVGCAGGAVVWGAGAAVAQNPADEWGAFEKLSSVFASLLASPLKAAELIDEQRFYLFISRCQARLADIEAAKRDVRDNLIVATCAGGDAVLLRARNAAQSVRSMVPALATTAKQLSSAIKPPGLRKDAEDAADALRSLNSRKMWVDRVSTYCSVPETQRKSFLAEVDASLALVRRCRESLGKMVDHLQR